MMRGFDYKSNKIGIDLLIARDFPTTRDYVQGLGRVGRYSEPSGRYKWKSNHQFSVVNKVEEMSRRGKIGKKVDEKVRSKAAAKTDSVQQKLAYKKQGE